MSLSTDSTAPVTLPTTPSRELIASLVSAFFFALSTAPDTASPTLSVTWYFSLMFEPKLRASKPPEAMPLRASATSSSLLAKYEDATKDAAPTQKPPTSSPTRPPKMLTVVILLSSVIFTNDAGASSGSAQRAGEVRCAGARTAAPTAKAPAGSGRSCASAETTPRPAARTAMYAKQPPRRLRAPWAAGHADRALAGAIVCLL
mmetsp:Transcript_149114/g.415599  ORF Transcript_149114/g.415599 Transcript_149114/m.415599 type:complete len:203 (-) Transcript_149114:62-670(-)